MPPSHQYWLAREAVRAIQRAAESGRDRSKKEAKRVGHGKSVPGGVTAGETRGVDEPVRSALDENREDSPVGAKPKALTGTG